MASVFLSYDHEDRGRAVPIAAALEKAGHSVWWDERISAGAEYNNEIEGAVEHADAVIVLWSQRSVRSAWVRDEAAEGRDRGKLVPVTIDGAKPPMGFRQYQTIDLSKRKRSGGAQPIQQLLHVVESMAAVGKSSTAAPLTQGPADRGRRLRITRSLLAVLAAALLIGSALVAWRAVNRSSVPIVAVVPAEDSPAANALARGLMVKLGSLRAARTDAMRLTATGGDARAKADFIFEAAGSSEPKDFGANLALVAGKDRELLWSKDFSSGDGNRTALEQSMAYTAGQVLDCALEASTPSQPRLDEPTLKLFLNGCALFGDRYRSDPAAVMPIFSQVVTAAPRFLPAWSKLLLAEAQYTRGQMAFFNRFAPGHLPQHIRAARQLKPDLPELYVAQAALLPLNNIVQRARLLDEAVQLSPDNPDVRVTRAEFLSFIGRNNDAVDDSRRAVQADPLSPGFRSNLIQILAYGGQVSAAQQELHRALQLWPASPTIDDARFRFNSRYGDARDALRMLQSAEFRQLYMTADMEPYLLARINPTDANVERAIAAARNPQLPGHRRPVQLIQLFAEFGRDDDAYKLLMNLPPDELRTVSGAFYRPTLHRLRQNPRFIHIAVRAGLVDFWRRSGKWPDFCFEPDLPYDCKKEATKLG